MCNPLTLNHPQSLDLADQSIEYILKKEGPWRPEAYFRTPESEPTSDPSDPFWFRTALRIRTLLVLTRRLVDAIHVSVIRLVLVVLILRLTILQKRSVGAGSMGAESSDPVT